MANRKDAQEEEVVPTIESSRLSAGGSEIGDGGGDDDGSGGSDTDPSDDHHEWETESLYEDALEIISDNELRRGCRLC